MRSHLDLLVAVLRGTWYVCFYRLFRRNVTIRFPFKAFARVRIEGPGSVFVDRNCAVHLNVFKGLSIVTLSPEARVRIGARCNLGGLTIRCRTHVSIGDRTMTAVSLVQDTLFLDEEKARENRVADRFPWAAPVAIGSNVWITMQGIVLGDTRIEDDSVLATGAVCCHYRALPYTLVSGNPAKRSLPISRVMHLVARR